MEPASPLLSAGFIMVCFLGAVRLSTGDESHCPCPKIPPWPLTEDPPEKCHQISDTFRYTCLVGYVRKAGTSNLIKCELKNKVGQWQNSTLQCIDDPKRPKLPTTPQSTTPKNLSDNPQDTTMTSTAKSSTSVYMKQSTVSQEGKTGDKVDDKAHDESHCPCPKIPPWPLTEDPPEKCHQISDTFRYTCLVGYVRKAGTSNLIKCELKNKVGQWQNSTLQCIDDPKRPKLPTTPQSTTPKNLSDNPQDTTMTSTAKSSTSVYMKQSTVSQEGKTGDKVDDKAHDAVTPTPGKIRKAETTTTRNGTSNPYADPTAAHSAGTQAAAIVSPILLVLICAAIGIGFILHWRKSRHNLPQQPGEELVPMNPACGLPS
ncbi:interleukin-15 receptor subunit alpha isoform X3 [Salarias fasciatus]|uniref:interleukin-15 receptor subunit alpha isoform X3 n=1 Tax=Salarias fasciatus TaxID=181472 RepID=UPI001176554D|nr:uncharacterized protein LOC115404127 isoform X3 [Salarias fasciatus]